jgi:hypothetical protein
MTRWIKGLAVVAVLAAIVAAMSGGAGATRSPSGASHFARSDTSWRGTLLKHANLQTVAGVKAYLRAIGVDPRGVVIQRGLRNYAGPSCPGAGWACASTAHAVVQIGRAGGMNRFSCARTHCAVVQASFSFAASPNKGVCIKTTGLTQSCTIVQTSAAPEGNTAGVYEVLGKMSGLTQTASYTASITQTGTGPAKNVACVSQELNIDGSTTALKGKPVTVTLRAHQNVTINQDSFAGNRAADAANSSGACTGDTLTQKQTLTSTAYGTAAIKQLENDDGDPTSGANLILTINQNQSPNYLGSANTHGTNTIKTSQQSNQVAQASGGVDASNLVTDGPITQTQSKEPDGGILATMNQFSKDLSTIDATQVENQCELAKRTGTLPTGGPLPTDANGCFTVDRTGNQLPAQLTQKQYGPMTSGGPARNTARRHLTRTGKDTSTQGDFAGDTFTVSQTSTQESDNPTEQHNVAQTTCTTSGACSGRQDVNNNNGTSHNGNAGTGNVTFDTNCTSACQTTANFPSGNIFVSVGGGKVQEWTPTATLPPGCNTPPCLVRTFDTGQSGTETTGLAFDAAKNLYVTAFQANNVYKFANDGTLVGPFGSGYNLHPESIVFDGTGNAYVGQADGSKNVLEFNPSGALQNTFAPTPELRGTDWIDLASDGCTLHYTSEGTAVKRFDVCTNIQGSDFATGLPGPAAYTVRLLPGGGALVADTDRIVRLDSSGSVVTTYGQDPGVSWFSLALDPSGTSFWAGDYLNGTVKKFPLSGGAPLATFSTGTGTAAGLAIAP